MAGLSAEQRNDDYLQAAIRTGLHKPILAALAAAQQRPSLADGELGLGISPANRIPLDQVNHFAKQVQYAANSLRSLIGRLTAQGWQGAEFWNADRGCYSDRLIQLIASGYVPIASDADAARLELTHDTALLQAYLEDWRQDCKAAGLPLDEGFGWLDQTLLKFAQALPRYYLGLSYQRQALLEASRIWRQLDDRLATIAFFLERDPADPLPANFDEARLDPLLLQALQDYSAGYSGYPHQREALLRLAQLWHQCPSREAAIAQLQAAPTAETSIQLIDPALIACIQRIPPAYQGKGDQRNALTEAYRLWYRLDSRGTALQQLGLDAQVMTASSPDRRAMLTAASQLDRALLDFVKQIPALYDESDFQREALIRLWQLWQGWDSRDPTLQNLLDTLQRLETARRDSPDAAPKPEPIPSPPRPAVWTSDNLQLFAAILPSGSLSWADATQGGRYLPAHPAAIEAVIRIAELAQQAIERIGRPLCITTWYQPTDQQQPERYAIGDAIQFYCDGLTGDQIYRALDPWWTGSLGRYSRYPHLCYVDAQPHRSRWRQP
ncbi:MAG: peptidase M15A [Pegethrix bostrychoides GSE-TBD4-15B]|jgi:hypothetical protein|uniref:Peptidase M15A n=1 Tax=Pegethrix bostrychoides GSE-TBD4-15B TaxID=2839662 RepID=A0A951PDZ0_9CYAN|nr:peptidase M15A [Pegethrix bostrychoides GSE-TBD4-15B]